MNDTKDRAVSYASKVAIALILLAIAIGFVVFSMLKTTPEDLEGDQVEVSSELPGIDPTGDSVPDHAPSVPTPTSPPPSVE